MATAAKCLLNQEALANTVSRLSSHEAQKKFAARSSRLHASLASSRWSARGLRELQTTFDRRASCPAKLHVVAKASEEGITVAGPRLRQPTGFQTSVRRRAVCCEAVKEVVGSLITPSSPPTRFAIVVGRFNENITRLLLAGALDAFARYGIPEDALEVVWVPGSFEIPIVAQQMAKSKKFSAVLCIGVVIRGATTHYDAVAGAAASGVLNAGLNAGVPCIFGVLTTENPEQAFDRAGGKAGNKGAEAAITAIEMANLMKSLKESGSAV